MPRLSDRAAIDAYTHIPEEYSTLRINVDFLASGKDIKALAVISAKRGEGRTTVAAKLGIAYAKAGKRTVIVDADLRNPGLFLHFGGEQGSGLSDLLVSNTPVTDMVRQTSIGCLSIIPAGPASLHASELLTSPSMDEMLSKLKERYEIVIIDCPPIDFIEARILAAKCDGAILVLEYGKISRELAQKTKEKLATVKVSLLGTVLNKGKE